jgi:REP element-mobilizing transposase RayT
MAQTYANFIAHVVFSTKHRLPFITPDLAPPLHAYLGGIIQELGGFPLIINGMPDHVHILLQLPLTQSVADILRVMKTNSSRWVRQTRDRNFEWQRGYAIFSVSRSATPNVIRYIRNQAVHHRDRAYSVELILLLRKHGVPFEERFIDQE